MTLTPSVSAQGRSGSHTSRTGKQTDKTTKELQVNSSDDTQEESPQANSSPQSSPPGVGVPLPRPADTTEIPQEGSGSQPHITLPVIHASSAILIDAISGQILYARNAEQARPMASTTKIMTALLFCEHVPNENTIVTASKFASTIRESSLHIKPNEKLTAHDLLRAILMRSANDACVVAAEHVSGSVEAFADLMNKRAVELGCTHTHFANPNGLNDRQHYTSAHDLALIARQATLVPRINEVTRLRYCRIKRSLDKKDVTMRNHAIRFLKKYAGADGIKTGWTIPAGHCFVGSATRKNWRLIAVVLNSPDFVHETSALMDYGYAHFTPRVLAHAGEPFGTCPVENGVLPTVPFVAQQSLQVVVPNNQVVPSGSIVTRLTLHPKAAPVHPGETVGLLDAIQDGKVVCSTPVVTTKGVSTAPKASLMAQSRAPFKSALWLTSIFVVGVVSLLYYGKGIAASTKSARRRWRRLTKSL